MPKLEESSRTGLTTASSCHRATVVNAGTALAESEAGLALCAATQIKQEADSVWLG